MEKMKMHSVDMLANNFEKLKNLFPNFVVESIDVDGKTIQSFDFEMFRQEFATQIIDDSQEKYRLTWPGKSNSLLLANLPIAKTLRPKRSESVDFDSTRNLFVEGDNLDVLKLIQDAYLEKVKFIYIDPPYNTGNDFLYEDDFSDSAENYLLRTNQINEDGHKMIANLDSSGRYHSDWLSMIYPRIRLARHLLRDDGVIFLSIGEEELSNLEKVCSEIFGESNKISIISRVAKTASNKGTHFAPSVDFLLCYAKNISYLSNFKDKVDADLYKKVEKNGPRIGDRYRDDIALYQSSLDPMRGCTNQRYYIQAPDGSLLLPPGSLAPENKADGSFIPPKSKEDKVWRWSYSTYFQKKDLLVFKETNRSPLIDENGNQAKWNIYTKSYLSDRQEDGTLPRNILLDFINRKGADLLKQYGISFDYSKPVELLEYLFDICGLSGDDLVLDFFAGSCTTAHAVINRNLSNGTNIRYICVQLPEDFESGDFKTVADIGKERIRRVGEKIQSTTNDLIGNDIDIGFRVLKIDTSNMSDVYYNPDAVSQDLLSDQADNVKADRTPEDLLFQVLLDWGVDLSLPIQKESIHGKDVYFVDQNALAACFDSKGGIDEEFVKELAKKQPLRVVFRDAGFKSDSVKINVEQIFKLVSPSTEVKCI